jgi:hypothetical protein
MRKAHRLVGWWLSVAITAGSTSVAHAQSTATFPEESAPGAQPQSTPPPLPPVRQQPVPAGTPPPAPGSVERPYTAQSQPAYSVPDLPAPGRDARPPILPYEEGLPVPAGYEVVDRPVTGLITAGVVGMVTSYGVGIIVGATQGFKNGTGFLLVPVVGPWFAIGTREYQCAGTTGTVAEAKKCVNSAVGEVQLITFMAVDGIAQLATGFVTLAGLLSTKKALLRTDLLPAKVSLIPPLPGHDGWSLTARGEF